MILVSLFPELFMFRLCIAISQEVFGQFFVVWLFCLVFLIMYATIVPMPFASFVNNYTSLSKISGDVYGNNSSRSYVLVFILLLSCYF